MDSWKRFCNWHSVLLHYYGVPVSAVVARGKTSAGSLFYHISQSCKCQQMKIKWRYFVPKIINIGVDLLELFEHITGVRNFLRHNVVCSVMSITHRSYVVAHNVYRYVECCTGDHATFLYVKWKSHKQYRLNRQRRWVKSPKIWQSVCHR